MSEEEKSRGAGGLDKNSDVESTVESDVPSQSRGFLAESSDGGSPNAFPVLHLGSQISFRPASRVSQNDKWINYPRVRHHDREEYETRPRRFLARQLDEEEFETFRELSKPLAMTGEEIGDAIQSQEKAFIPKLRTCCLSFVNEAHLPACRKMTDRITELDSLREELDRCAADSDKPLDAGIGVAVGFASMCWEYPERAGVFDSTRASALIPLLREWILKTIREMDIPVTTGEADHPDSNSDPR